MSEERRVTAEDELLRIRFLCEGVRLEVKKELEWKGAVRTPWTDSPVIILDWCDLVCRTMPNPHSSLKLTVDGSDVTVTEMDKVLGTAKIEPRPSWCDKLLSDGTPVMEAGVFTHYAQSAILINNSCYAAQGLGKPCKFCAYSSMGTKAPPRLSFAETLEMVDPQIEATAVAVQNGWSAPGGFQINGGAQPPWRRDQWTTDMFEAIIARFRELLDDDTLSRLINRPSVYPPKDLGQLYKWKSLGINSCEFDCEVLDPAFFKAMCPGRGDQRQWFEAQEAGVEIFGWGNCYGNLVAGIEPLAGMLEGIEERASKGVYCSAIVFRPLPGTPLAGMRPPSAEWYLELKEKMNEIYSRHNLFPFDYF